jgi:hypothetical protein
MSLRWVRAFWLAAIAALWAGCGGASPLGADAASPAKTGEVFAERQPYLVEMGHTTLRKCTRAEGGDAAPDTLPACP